MTPLGIVSTVLYFLLLAFLLLMWVRLIFDWIRVLRRRWRPRGAALVIAEIAYAVTDPPVKLVRRILPPVRLGAVSLDFAWSIVLLVCIVLMWVVARIG